jgi:hypothetical protein
MIDYLYNKLSFNKEEGAPVLPRSLTVFAFLFAFICIFASVDFFVLAPSDLVLSNFFLKGFFSPKFFSLLDLLVIGISVYLMIFHKINLGNASGIQKFIFLLAIICFVLKMANPNNSSENPVFGLPLFSEINNYSFLIFFGTIISLPKRIFYAFILKLFEFATYAAILRSIILLGLYAAGQSRSFFFGIKSCLLEGDTLLILGLFQSVTFGLYLINKDKKYLISWFLLVLVQVFSTRRSPLFTALFCNAIVFAFYYVRKMNAFNKMATILILVFTVFILPVAVSSVSPQVKVYLDRYLGVFSSDSYSTDPANSDSGHFEQSQKTTEAALKIGFWGVGYGHKLVLEGAFSINGEYFIHNVFAALWALHGVYMVIFYLFMVLLVLMHFLKLVTYNGEFFHLALIKMSVVVFYLMYMHAMYYTTLNFVVSSKMQYILILVLCYILMFNKAEFEEFSDFFKSKSVEMEKVKPKNYVAF